MRGNSYKRDELLIKGYSLCVDMYFLDIMSILRFCDFVIFPNRHNTLILQFFTLFFKNSGKFVFHSWM